jgi:hypothetical protein
MVGKKELSLKLKSILSHALSHDQWIDSRNGSSNSADPIIHAYDILMASSTAPTDFSNRLHRIHLQYQYANESHEEGIVFFILPSLESV